MWKEQVRLTEKVPASVSSLPFDGLSAAELPDAFSFISLEGKQISCRQQLLRPIAAGRSKRDSKARMAINGIKTVIKFYGGI